MDRDSEHFLNTEFFFQRETQMLSWLRFYSCKCLQFTLAKTGNSS